MMSRGQKTLTLAREQIRRLRHRQQIVKSQAVFLRSKKPFLKLTRSDDERCNLKIQVLVIVTLLMLEIYDC